MISRTRSAIAALLVWTMAMTVLSAGDASSQGSQVEIHYSSAVYDFGGDQKRITLEGPITIETPTLRVSCDHAVILASREDQPQATSNLGNIDSIVAKGNVVIEQQGTRALAGKATIIPAERKLILEDEPSIVDRHGTVSGHRIIFLQGERQIRIESGGERERSRIEINDVRDVGFLMGEEATAPIPPASVPPKAEAPHE